MFLRRSMIATAATGLMLTPNASSADTSNGAAVCVSDVIGPRHHIVAVGPYVEEEHDGYVDSKRLAGARIDIQAAPGLTAEWLNLTLDRRMENLKASAIDCGFDLNKVKLGVVSNGTGFSVRFTSSKDKDSREILRGAELMGQ